MARLPQPGADSGRWGEILNEYLLQSHTSDGSLKDIPQSKVTNLESTLASKANSSAIPTLPSQVGAEPVGLSQSTKGGLNSTFGEGYDVIIGAGQSNNLGFLSPVDAAIDTAEPGVKFWGTNPDTQSTYHKINEVGSQSLLGPMNTDGTYTFLVGFARRWQATYNRRVLIIPMGVGGAGFEGNGSKAARWKATDVAGRLNLCTGTINETIAAIAATGEPCHVVGILWNQGEADANVNVSQATHTANFDAMLARIRSEIPGAANAPVVVARQPPERRAADGANGLGVDAAHIDTPGRVPLSALVDPPAGFVGGDNTHYTTEGHRRLSALYWDAFQRARINRTGLAAPIVPNLKATAVSDNVTVTWDMPTGGRTKAVGVSYWVGTGAWSTPVIVTPAAGKTVFTTGVFNTPVQIRAYTVGDGGNSDIVSTSVTTGADSNAALSLSSFTTPPLEVWALRKAIAEHSLPCIKVRRSSDDTTLDIGFSANLLDTTALLAFVGAGSGYIDTWYDQSGHNRHLTQPTLAFQPRIVNAGTLDTIATGKPSAVWDGTDDVLSGSFAGLYNDTSPVTTLAVVEGLGVTNGCVFSEGRSTAATGYYMFMRTNSNGRMGTVISSTGTDLSHTGNSVVPFTAGAPHMAMLVDSRTEATHVVDTQSAPAVTYTRNVTPTTPNRTSVGALVRNTTSNWWPGKMTEVWGFQANVAADQALVQASAKAKNGTP